MFSRVEAERVVLSLCVYSRVEAEHVVLSLCVHSRVEAERVVLSPSPPLLRKPGVVLHAGGSDQKRERQGGAVPLHLQGHHRVQAAHRG